MHDIEENNAFYFGKPAWHGLGVTLEEHIDTREAALIAYAGRHLIELELKAHLEDTDETMDIDTHKAIVRSDGELLGVVGSGYTLIQPEEAFDFFQPWLDSGLVTLEAGGSLRNGTRLWALAAIKNSEEPIVGNDTVKSYCLVYTSFDGSLAHGIGQTNVRVVCNNTLQFADQIDADSIVRFKHTKNLKSRIDNVKQDIDRRLAKHHNSVLMYRQLAEKKMERKEQELYIEDVFITKQMKEKAIEEKKPISTKTLNKVQTVQDLIDNQRGLELVPATRETAWQAYNAVTEYLTHDAGNGDDSRLNAQWFGGNRAVNSRALELALAA